MARTISFTEEDIERAKQVRDNPANEREYRAAMIVLLKHETNFTREKIANLFGVDVKTVFSDMESIRNPASREPAIWGGGNNRLMTYDEEAQFLAQFSDEAQAGHIITMPQLHHEYNLRVGKETPKSTFYRLLKRHNWRKVLPDNSHPKGDPIAQEEFKKKPSKFSWIKL